MAVNSGLSGNQNPPLSTLFTVIHEDHDLLVINKPADLVCHPSKNGELSSLIGRVRLHLGTDARPHLVNRLDRETSGLTVVAKTDTAARELGRIWSQRRVSKEYLAIVQGHVDPDCGTIDAALGKDQSSRVAIRDCVRTDGAAAQTSFEVLRRFRHGDAAFSLLRVQPHTGRKHQIRIHLAHIGHAIVGDKIYGSDEDAYLALVEGRLGPEQRAALIFPTHALHASALRFDWRGEAHEFCCEPECWFSGFSAAV
jgi:23S rRNA pseudouridine1911/1915/1917 synthase